MTRKMLGFMVLLRTTRATSIITANRYSQNRQGRSFSQMDLGACLWDMNYLTFFTFLRPTKTFLSPLWKNRPSGPVG